MKRFRITYDGAFYYPQQRAFLFFWLGIRDEKGYIKRFWDEHKAEKCIREYKEKKGTAVKYAPKYYD